MQCVVVLPLFLLGDPSAAVLSPSFPSKLSHGVGEGTVLYREVQSKTVLSDELSWLHGSRSKVAPIILNHPAVTDMKVLSESEMMLLHKRIMLITMRLARYE